MDGKTQREQRKVMQVESSTPALFFRSGAQNLDVDALSRNPAMALLQEKRMHDRGASWEALGMTSWLPLFWKRLGATNQLCHSTTARERRKWDQGAWLITESHSSTSSSW